MTRIPALTLALSFAWLPKYSGAREQTYTTADFATCHPALVEVRSK